MRLVGATAFYALSVLFARAAGANCVAPIQNNFDISLGGPTFASAPASDASFPTGPAYTYHVATTVAGPTISTLLRKFKSSDGSIACTATITGEKAVADPTPVPLSSGQTAIFLATDAGKVYRFDTACSGVWSPSWAPGTGDVRRYSPSHTLLCTSGQLDTIAAAPSVMLSNPAYYAKGVTPPAQDLVIVPTHYGCTSTDNRVIGLSAASGAIVFRSNIFAAPSDYFSDSCTIDYNTGLVYCGSNDPGGAFQNTVFAYDGSQTGTVTPVLQLKPGAVSTRLNIRNNHLIVGTSAGVLMGYDLAGVAQGTSALSANSWSVNLGSPIRKSPVAEQRYGFSRTILVVTSDGRLHRVDEDPAFTASRVGPPLVPATDGVITGGLFSTNLAMFSEQGKVFVGASDGFMYQIDFTGATFNPATSIQAYVAAIPGSVPSAGPGSTTVATVYDPLLDYTPSPSPVVDKITMSSTSRLRQYQIPWVNNCSSTSTWPAGGATCDPRTNPCPTATSPECSDSVCMASGQCAFAVKPGSQGQACTIGLLPCVVGGGTCSDGRCVGNYQRCNGGGGTCTSPDSESCAPGTTCCAGTCQSLANNTDVHNCGGCAIDCDPTSVGDHQCVNGHCERQTNCRPPSAALVKRAVASKVSQISFDYAPGGDCRAYLSQTGAAPMIRIDSTGNGTSITERGANYATIPLNGVSATLDGALVASNQSSGIRGNINLGMAIVSTANLDNFSPLYPTAQQIGVRGLYSDPNFDSNAVGPVWNNLYVPRDLARRAYIADLPGSTNLAYVDVTQSGDTYTYSRVLRANADYPGRITALTFGIRSSGSTKEGTIYAAFTDPKTMETYVDVYCNATITNKKNACVLPTRRLDLGPATPYDFADAVDPDRSFLMPAITGVLSMANDPTYGGVFLTARDTNGNLQALYIDPVGLSVRNFHSWPFPNGRVLPNPTIGTSTDDIRPSVSQFQFWGLLLNGFANGDYALATWATPR